MNIFDTINENDKQSLLNCLRAVKKTYLKDEIIFDNTKEIFSVGYIIKGHVRILKDDYEGNKIIITDIHEGETFGEAIVLGNFKMFQQEAVAVCDTEILFMDIKRVLTTCQNSCQFHRKLIENIIKTVVQKNNFLQERLELLAKKTLRERILYFLYNEKSKQNETIFKIQYSREQMAEFLRADRSALSRELSKMKKENILDYHKNLFKIF